MLNSNIMDVIRQRKDDRSSLIRMRKNEVFARIPRIAEIENRLTATGMVLLSRVADNEMSAEDFVARIMAENRELNEEKARLLTSHGYSSDYFEPPYVCALCSDTGYNSENKICNCLKAELTKRALKEANLTEHMAGQTFESFDLSFYSAEFNPTYGMSERENILNILEITKEFVSSFDTYPKNLLFYGTSGLGKTFLSSAIANELIKKGVDVLYISSNNLFSMLEDLHFGRGDEKSSYIAEKVLNSELLILDDLGAEFITQFTTSELFRIVNHRLLTGKKMIFSTNLTLSQLTKTYSERIVSRIIGEFENLVFFGEDIRKKKKYN
ncbi:MAG: ATP-binding protein [Clostridia bacterium]|nr:ATP-binding protein [Clostridia bacterium]